MCYTSITMSHNETAPPDKMVRISPEQHGRLVQLAAANYRDCRGQLEFLIDEAYRAHVSSTQQAPQPAATEV